MVNNRMYSDIKIVLKESKGSHQERTFCKQLVNAGSDYIQRTGVRPD